jgi:hypothetical protein
MVLFNYLMEKKKYAPIEKLLPLIEKNLAHCLKRLSFVPNLKTTDFGC